MEKFLIEARKLAYGEVEKTGMPVKVHVDLATEVDGRFSLATVSRKNCRFSS